jgi:hypothetical protein
VSERITGKEMEALIGGAVDTLEAIEKRRVFYDEFNEEFHVKEEFHDKEHPPFIGCTCAECRRNAAEKAAEVSSRIPWRSQPQPYGETRQQMRLQEEYELARKRNGLPVAKPSDLIPPDGLVTTFEGQNYVSKGGRWLLT